MSVWHMKQRGCVSSLSPVTSSGQRKLPQHVAVGAAAAAACPRTPIINTEPAARAAAGARRGSVHQTRLSLRLRHQVPPAPHPPRVSRPVVRICRGHDSWDEGPSDRDWWRRRSSKLCFAESHRSHSTACQSRPQSMPVAACHSTLSTYCSRHSASSPRRGSHRSAWGTAQRRPRTRSEEEDLSPERAKHHRVRLCHPFRASNTASTFDPGRRCVADAISLCLGLVCGCPCGASEELVFKWCRDQCSRRIAVGWRRLGPLRPRLSEAAAFAAKSDVSRYIA